MEYNHADRDVNHISFTAADIIQGLGGKWYGRHGMACCPAHAERTGSLHVSQGRRGVVVHCFGGCTQDAVIDALRAMGLWHQHTADIVPFRTRPKHIKTTDEDEKRRQLAIGMWDATIELNNTPGERYLANRKIRLKTLPKTLRWLPETWHPSGQTSGAIIAAVQDGMDEICAIHRIFVSQDGRKAFGKESKLSLGQPLDGAVRLREPDGGAVLGITEGIENALSVERLFAIPVWSSISSSRMVHMTFPFYVKSIIIFADYDKAGVDAAENAASTFRQQRKRVTIKYPSTPKKDWNDVLQQV